MPPCRRTIVLSALLGLLLVPAVLGQGSLADYERAAAMPAAVRGLVRNETLETRWIDDHTLTLRVDAGPGAWRFLIVDARTGATRDAFDHRGVAEGLSSTLERDIAPDAIPIARLGLERSTLLGLVEPELRVFAIAVGARNMREISLDQATPFLLPEARARRSRDDGGSTHVLFVNRTADAMSLYWIDRMGERHSYGTLAPGAQRRQHTFAGHAWAATDTEGTGYGPFRATRAPALALLGGAPAGPGGRATGAAPAPATQKVPGHPEARGRNVSPDGRWSAEIREHDLVLRSRASGAITAVTDDGSAEDACTNRVTWSPDGAHLLVIRERPAQEHLVHVVESAPDDHVQPKLRSFQYLKPGDRIAHPRPALFSIRADTGAATAVPIDDALFPNPWSIGEITWAADSGEVRFLYNQRGHQTLRLIGIDAGTGAARAIIDETSETFLDYTNKRFLHLVAGTDEAIWMSERDGWNHVYLYDLQAGTPIAQCTAGDWVVRGIERVDEAARQIWFRAMGVYPDQDPYHVHYGRVDFDGGNLTWLTDGDGTHEIRFSPGSEYFIDTWSRVDRPPVHELRRASDGSRICELARADWTALLDTGWTPPQRFTAKGRDGTTDIWGVLFTPTTFAPQRAHPVIEQIYAGPHGHFVPKQFAAWHGARAIAELGFVVVQIDGMGTNWRSKAFHDVAWRNLGDSGFRDRIAWIRAAAAERPWMNLRRVGIYGGSAGGQSALRALLAHGEFYHAAVADCGCHDNRMDKIWWNELWMGWPIGDHYAEQSNVTQAHRLAGKLLLIVGGLDQNVDPASTMQVVDALIDADKDFDLLVIPSAGHGAAETPYGKRRRADFFVEHLLGREPRWTRNPD